MCALILQRARIRESEITRGTKRGRRDHERAKDRSDGLWLVGHGLCSNSCRQYASAHRQDLGRNQGTIDEINQQHTNSRFHSGVVLPEKITATTDPAAALDDADVVVLAIPAQTLRENLRNWGKHLPEKALVVSLLKGFERSTHARMSEVILEELGIDESQVAVATGPNLAGEIIKREPAAVVIACSSEEHAVELQDAFATPYFRPYTSVDVVGCEVAGTIKNVMALAVGMASGLGMGDNTKATVITRGLAETTRLGVALGADPMTFAGLAGMGDLVATCSSPLSRNRSFGERLGRVLDSRRRRARLRQPPRAFLLPLQFLISHESIRSICQLSKRLSMWWQMECHQRKWCAD